MEANGQNSHSIEKVSEGQSTRQGKQGSIKETKKRVEDLHKIHHKLTTLKECKIFQNENSIMEVKERSIHDLNRKNHDILLL